MTINSQTRTAGPFAGTGAIVPCPFSFKVFQASDLRVVIADAAGVQTDSVLSVGHTVALNADQNAAPGGYVTPLAALPVGSQLSITSQLELLQPASLTNTGGYYPKVIEDALDRLTILMQEQGFVSGPQTLRVPDIGGVSALPPAASRANHVLAFDSNGDPITIPGVDAGSAAALALDLADKSSATKGPGMVGYSPTLNYAAQTIGASLNDRGIDLMSLVTSQAERAAIKAGTSSADHSPLFNAAFILGRRVYVPAGAWRLLSTVALPTGFEIQGAGFAATSIRAYGCDAFSISAGGGYGAISSVAISSFASGGAADPRTFVAVFCNGASGNNVNYVTIRDAYLQGWADAVNWRYTWNSTVDNITTVNCNFGLNINGQCVNNAVSNSRLVCNGGTASISTSQVSTDAGEGLMVSNTLMASGNYGVRVNGSFLSLHIANSVIDLVAIDAVNSTDCRDLRISNSWLYAGACCVRLAALGTATAQGVSLIGNGLRLTAGSGNVISQGGANIGLTMTGNRLTFSGAAIGVALDGQAGVVDGNYFDNTGSGADVNLSGSASTHRVGKNTKTSGAAITLVGGFATQEYSEASFTPADVSGASLVLSQTSPGHYVKHGRMVTVSIDFRFPVTANSSTAKISLPFAPPAGVASFAGCIGFQDINGTFMVNGSTGDAAFRFLKPGATAAYATNAELSNARFLITFTYEASA